MRRRDFINAVAGVAALWPLAARTQQQPKLPVVGYLSTGSPEADATPFLAAFRKGLGEMSFVEGKNVAIEYRWANFRYDRLSAMAADLAQRSVAVIAAIGGTPTGLAAKAATSVVPIVFYLGIDPVKFGLVASLNRPGGNVTGIAALQAELVAKRIQFLHELVPKARVVALLANPDNPYTEPEAQAVQDAAHSLGLGELQILRASSASEIDAVFQRLPQLHVDALIVSADLFLLSQQKRIVAAATQYNLPTMYPWREYVPSHQGGGHRPGTHQRRSSTPPWHRHAQAGLERPEEHQVRKNTGQRALQDGGGCSGMRETAPTLSKYEKALHQMLDENEALRAEVTKLNGQLSSLVNWINGDADALTTLQGLYLNPDEPAGNRIKAAAAAIGYERPKLTATANVIVDFRERVRQARLKADAKLIEHTPDERIAEPA